MLEIMLSRVARLLAGIITVAVCAGLAAPSGAVAGEQAWWRLLSSTRPTNLRPGGDATIVLQATNLGDVAVDASEVPVIMKDKLPPGVEATAAKGVAGSNFGFSILGAVTCSVTRSEVECSWSGPQPLQPYERVEVTIAAEVEPSARSGAKNEASIEGGQSYPCEPVEGTGRFASDFCKPTEEAATPGTGDFEAHQEATVPTVSNSHAISVSESGETPFGIEEYGVIAENEGGLPDTQAGSHPFQLTTALTLNQTALPSKPPGLVKDVSADLPPGLVGNATALPRCTEAEFSTTILGNANLCPADTAVGVAAVTLEFTTTHEFTNRPIAYAVPIFNLVPAPGEPARFGFEAARVPVLIDTSIRTGSDYGVTATISDATQSAAVISSYISLWGVPSDSRHDRSRGWSCVSGGFYNRGALPACSPTAETESTPFLRLPTSCTGALESSAEADSWQAPGTLVQPLSTEPMSALSGCNRLPFSAEITTAPTVSTASSPAGLTVDTRVNQEPSANLTGLATADVKDVSLTLPAGVVVNPSSAGGLEACSESEIGYEAAESMPPGGLRFTSGLPAPREAPLEPFCPNASKIGKVKITTPLLEGPLEGAVYVAAQDENPFASLIAIYIVAEEAKSGVLVKLAGDVSLNPETGQLVTTFLNTPQTPFEDLEVEFFGGERAALATPAHCGDYTTNASFAPWSGTASVNAASRFAITSGPRQEACAGALPFAPTLSAGTTDNQAGGFSPFTTTISREDGDQDIQAVSVHTPPGLSGLISSITPCEGPQAETGLCGPASQIGETTVSVGVGDQPYTVSGGKVYITGPYEGAPFGLSIAVPAKAGPYDLAKGTPCDCVVVRAKIEVDPHSGQLTVTTDSQSGPHPIPRILDGVPLEIKRVNVTIGRPGFTFNPTDCRQMAVTGSTTSTEGAVSNQSVPFEVANCAGLKFAPKFSVSTSGHTSKADGASLTAKLVYPSAPLGSQANIARAKVDLPKQLPSRLSTLQKACVAAVFAANPANCPSASVVGHAIVRTPVLPVPLVGPAYLVSHAGEEFPNLTLVLQGDNVTIDLVGDTLIRHKITSTTFAQTPDVPFSTFELTLPEGPDSVLAANGDLCKSKLAMPTEFIAQNGAEIHETTTIKATGCPRAPRAKVLKRHAQHKARKH